MESWSVNIEDIHWNRMSSGLGLGRLMPNEFPVTGGIVPFLGRHDVWRGGGRLSQKGIDSKWTECRKQGA